jgi:hypothetical protein
MFFAEFSGVIGLALILLLAAGFEKAWRDHRHPWCAHSGADIFPLEWAGLCRDQCCPGYGEVAQCAPHRSGACG